MALNLKITGNGMNVDQEITLMQAGKIITFLGSESEIIEAPTGPQLIDAGTPTVAAQPSLDPRRSVREALERANPRTHAQKITVFGHFVAEADANGMFTTDEVKLQYQAAREKAPLHHFSRELDGAVSSGWIAPAQGESNTYFVTQKGERAIEESFSTASKTRAKSKPANTKSAMISDEDVSDAVSGIQPVVPTLEGFPNYHKLKSKGLKVMWILAMAQTHGIDSLSTKEIAYFAGKLRDKIEIRDMNGHTGTGAKNGWLTKDNSAKYILLHDGEEQLKSLLSEDAPN